MATFEESISALLDSLPEHSLKGGVEVNQVYAHYQHEHPEFHHPDGGGAFYLKDPLFGKLDDYMQHLASKTITAHGSEIEDAMAENMEALSQEVYERAPFEFGDLKASGHPTVEKDGVLVYDRPPMVERLDETDLRIKSHLRYLYDPHRYSR